MPGLGTGEGYFTSGVNRTFFAHLFKAIFRQHHRGALPLLRRFIPEDGVVLDAGAHAGQFTKLFASLATRGLVLACEPGTYARSVLRLALFAHRLSNVAILPLALGDRAGVALLRLPIKRRGSYGFGLSHLGPGDGRRPVAIEAVGQATLDEIVAVLALDRLDFIKADIEGWELRLVSGAAATLARFRPVLLLELSAPHLARAGDTLAAAWSTLAAQGYHPHAATPEARLVRLPAPVEGDIWWLPREKLSSLASGR